MSTIYVRALQWDALPDVARQAAIEAEVTPVLLGDPATVYGDFDVEGTFVPAAPEDSKAPTWYVWDDHRLTEAHVLAIAGAVS